MSAVVRKKKRKGWLRSLYGRFFERKANTVAAVVLLLSVLSAVGADFLAAEKPIACRMDGELFLFPNVVEYAELADHDNQSIERAVAQRGGWVLLPPVRYGPYQTKVNGTVKWLEPPGEGHPLGTDDAGRDVLARIIHGARSAHLVGVGAVFVSTLFGVLIGSLAAYFGGFPDRVALVLIETLTAFPAFFLILVIQGMFGTTSLWQLVLIIGATRWTDVARITRGEVLRIVNEDYVYAARALGLRHATILLRHVLPGSAGPVLVSATFGVAGAILIESTLSFLGYGAPAPAASWGQLLTDAFDNEGCYWLAIFPGVVLSATVLSINLVGEGLRDAVDPAG